MMPIIVANCRMNLHSTRCRRRKVGSTPSTRNWWKTSALRSRERRRSRSRRWTFSTPTSRLWCLRSRRMTSTVDLRRLDSREGGVARDSAGETRMRTTNTMDIGNRSPRERKKHQFSGLGSRGGFKVGRLGWPPPPPLLALAIFFNKSSFAE